MNGTPSPTFLLIADISGYTRFMRLHALTTSHARQIIVRLLKALIDASRPPLQVAELEGDAVFFYAAAPGGDLDRVAAQIEGQILRFHQVFEAEIEALSRVTACVCEACRNVRQLRLKQVAHAGEAALEQIGRFEKLFGVDVILVHRMLKNTIRAGTYVMMTDPALGACRLFYGLAPERRSESLEGFGDVGTVVFYEQDLRAALARLPEERPLPSFGETLGWKMKMHRRTILELLAPRRRKTEAGAPVLT